MQPTRAPLEELPLALGMTKERRQLGQAEAMLHSYFFSDITRNSSEKVCLTCL